MEVDSFRCLSPLIKRYYQLSRVKKELPIPFSPLRKPLHQCCFGLVTSGGLYHKGHERPFDEERERREPSWGDPSFRTLPADMDATVTVTNMPFWSDRVVPGPEDDLGVRAEVVLAEAVLVDNRAAIEVEDSQGDPARTPEGEPLGQEYVAPVGGQGHGFYAPVSAAEGRGHRKHEVVPARGVDGV
jgi:hypothetical protein